MKIECGNRINLHSSKLHVAILILIKNVNKNVKNIIAVEIEYLFEN